MPILIGTSTAGGIASPYEQKRSRAGQKSRISGVLQPTFHGPKTNQWRPMLELSDLNSMWRNSNGDTRNHQDLPPERGVGYLSRLQGCLLPHTYTGRVQEISEISHPRSDIPVQGTAFQFVHSTHGVHCIRQGGETDGHTQGKKDPPVPRRLVGVSQIPPKLVSSILRN